MSETGERLQRNRPVAAAWATLLGGVALMLGGSATIEPLGSPAVFLAAFFGGLAIVLTTALRMRKWPAELPAQAFSLPQAMRRWVIVGANALFALAHLPMLLAPAPWNAAGYVLLFLLGAAVLAIFLRSYQIWVFGRTKGLDEYHLGRRRRARDLAYAGLAFATLAGLAVCGVLRWTPDPQLTPLIAYGYFWFVLTLPCAVLAWTEPDDDPG